MFDLNRSVKKLAAQVCGGWIARRLHQAEIEDYLFCVIEENVRTGLTEQQAFDRARVQIGEAATLRAELKRARKSERSWQSMATTAIVLLAIAGVLWQQSELSRQAATDLLAVAAMPLKWLGLLA